MVAQGGFSQLDQSPLIPQRQRTASLGLSLEYRALSVLAHPCLRPLLRTLWISGQQTTRMVSRRLQALGSVECFYPTLRDISWVSAACNRVRLRGGIRHMTSSISRSHCHPQRDVSSIPKYCIEAPRQGMHCVLNGFCTT